MLETLQDDFGGEALVGFAIDKSNASQTFFGAQMAKPKNKQLITDPRRVFARADFNRLPIALDAKPKRNRIA